MKNLAKQRRGAAVVEMAIAAPVFFVVMLTVFEFGWMAVIRHTADNAAYEAVRRSVIPGGTSADARQEATRLMQIVGARQFNVEVNPTNITPETDEVEVTVRGNYAQNGLIATRFLTGLQFESRSRMLTQRPRRLN